MTDEQKLYDEAFRQMGTAPPEHGENLGPKHGGRRAGAGRKPGDAYGTKRPPVGDEPRQKISVTIDVTLLALVDEHAKAHNQARSASLNEILAQALTPHT